MSYKLNPFTGKLDNAGISASSNDLESVLINGNTSGANDISFDATQGILFSNYSRLREGTIDALLGGTKGIAQICAVGYELKWEAGRLYVMDGNGVFIRHSLYNFNVTPTVTDDDTKGYLVGSRWSLDDGTVYICTDSTTGAAVWQFDKYLGSPIEFQVAASDESTPITTGLRKAVFRSTSNFVISEVRASLSIAQTTGSLVTVDVNLNGTSILGTKITIDNGETTSVTATTPYTLSTSTVADNDEISIDIDTIGDGSAIGLKVQIIGNRV
jgi:hypothetical protein